MLPRRAMVNFCPTLMTEEQLPIDALEKNLGPDTAAGFG